MNTPNDPYILLSLCNTKLRDEDLSLEDLAAALGVTVEDLEMRLSAIGAGYDEAANQFKQL